MTRGDRVGNRAAARSVPPPVAMPTAEAAREAAGGGDTMRAGDAPMPDGDLPRRSIWLNDDGASVSILDQTSLPHAVEVVRLDTLEAVAVAIRTMQVRGAPLIGAAAAYGLAFAAAADASDTAVRRAADMLRDTRPTAVNLHHALDTIAAQLLALPPAARRAAAFDAAATLCAEDVAINEAIGRHGLALLRTAHEAGPNRPVHVLTHCNAGWLATVGGGGTALSPIYAAQDAGVPVHVWVSETRPRNQGAALTAWELAAAGVPHTVIADNAAGHLLQRGRVDLVITGTDRTLPSGDVCNKIGTYLKAVAAHDNDVPFYVAAPSPSIDWERTDPIAIPIEERAAEEVTTARGRDAEGRITTVELTARGTAAANFAFDVTPARLVSGLITERGVAVGTGGLRRLFPERFADAAHD